MSITYLSAISTKEQFSAYLDKCKLKVNFLGQRRIFYNDKLTRRESHLFQEFLNIYEGKAFTDQKILANIQKLHDVTDVCCLKRLAIRVHDFFVFTIWGINSMDKQIQSLMRVANLVVEPSSEEVIEKPTLEKVLQDRIPEASKVLLAWLGKIKGNVERYTLMQYGVHIYLKKPYKCFILVPETQKWLRYILYGEKGVTFSFSQTIKVIWDSNTSIKLEGVKVSAQIQLNRWMPIYTSENSVEMLEIQGVKCIQSTSSYLDQKPAIDIQKIVERWGDSAQCRLLPEGS
jgi:hypothetical protein